jgi:ppGpp synthetase/RelA/SpoT-type nucleotidyltranferase
VPKEVITEFVAAYTREFDYYQAAARLCSQRCEALLTARGVRAIVSHRAKRPQKLLAKLIERDVDKSYASSQQIREDIADLAGARIALYFPGDRERVRSILRDSFSIVEEKRLPDDTKKKRSAKRFAGYYADHYRLYIQDASLDEAQKQYSTAMIEVQVGSVLMHAWAEVEHDLIYKPESGEISEDEDAILDEINGLVITGEVALERLQRR